MWPADWQYGEWSYPTSFSEPAGAAASLGALTVEPAPGLWLSGPPGLEGGGSGEEESDVEKLSNRRQESSGSLLSLLKGEVLSESQMSHEGENEPNSEPSPSIAKCLSTSTTADDDDELCAAPRCGTRQVRMSATLRRKLLLMPPCPESQPNSPVLPQGECHGPLSELPVRYQRRPRVRAAWDTITASLCVDAPLDIKTR